MLRQLYDDWKDWAATADSADDGWESNYPGWSQLMAAACATLTKPRTTPDELLVLAHCWRISAETEDLLDYAKDNIDDCWPSVARLAASDLRDCRWQVYEAAARAGVRADGLLRAGMEDKDNYVRRRAALALALIAPADAAALCVGLMEDVNPYMRQAALVMAKSSSDPKTLADVRTALAADPVAHVRDAAQK